MSVHFTLCDKVDQFRIFDDSIHLESFFKLMENGRMSGIDFEFNIGTESARKMLDPEYLFSMILLLYPPANVLLLHAWCFCHSFSRQAGRVNGCQCCLQV
jgi:hypothetical protein